MKWLAALLLVIAAPAGAQAESERTFRLGHLAPSMESIEATRKVTLPELAKLGFVEGRNLVVLDRIGDEQTTSRLARGLIDAKVDVIVAIGPSAIRSAAAASKTIPIVIFGGDPTHGGLAASYAHPGGNVTGVVILPSELDAKRLELLHQAVPSARRIAALMMPDAPTRGASERDFRKYAAENGITLQFIDASRPEQYAAAFAAMRAGGAQALVIMANAVFYRDRLQLIALAQQSRLPTVCEWAEMAEAGCLLGYGPNRTELRRRVAHFVARIFRGATPAELPIEIPTLFEFAINLKTARSLGIAIPEALSTRADKLIE